MIFIVVTPEILKCENGHCFCSNCYESLKKEGQECPVCRGQLTKARCLAVEKMLEKLPKAKCRYEDCQFKRAEAEVVHRHETDCLFRLVECGVCKEGIPLSSIAGHLEVAHEIRFVQQWLCFAFGKLLPAINPLQMHLPGPKLSARIKILASSHPSQFFCSDDRNICPCRNF